MRDNLVVIDGSVPVVTDPSAVGSQYTVRTDWASDTVLYKGWAVVGSLPGSAVWSIYQRTFDANGGYTELWANGNKNKTNIWDNRVTTISYS